LTVLPTAILPCRFLQFQWLPLFFKTGPFSSSQTTVYPSSSSPRSVLVSSPRIRPHPPPTPVKCLNRTRISFAGRVFLRSNRLWRLAFPRVPPPCDHDYSPHQILRVVCLVLFRGDCLLSVLCGRVGKRSAFRCLPPPKYSRFVDSSERSAAFYSGLDVRKVFKRAGPWAFLAQCRRACSEFTFP